MALELAARHRAAIGAPVTFCAAVQLAEKVRAAASWVGTSAVLHAAGCTVHAIHLRSETDIESHIFMRGCNGISAALRPSDCSCSYQLRVPFRLFSEPQIKMR